MGETQTPAPTASDNLTPLPKRVADELVEGDHPIADPIEFVEQLLERGSALLVTLQTDVEGLEADQRHERVRIEQHWQQQQEAVDAATDRLERMGSLAHQIAAHKARLAEFERAVNPPVPPVAPDAVTIDEFHELMGTIDRELKAAKGITGAIRLPQIAGLLNQAAVALSVLADQADRTRQQLLARTDDDLTAEGTEARASFEIGLGVLQRDLAMLDRALPLEARAWNDPGWADWQPPDAPQAWVRVGVRVHTRLPDTPIPFLMPVTCGPGVVIEGGSHRDLAVDGVRSLVLRLMASLPPGQARFTFIDPQAMGETVAPFLSLADYDPALVGGGALVVEDEIEEHLEGLARHVERVAKHALQGRYPTLDAYHEELGELVEPYRYLVVVDHPSGFSDRATSLLRGLVESGPRCGVTTIVVRAPKSRSSARTPRGLPSMPTVKSTTDGLVVESLRSGTWALRPDVPPLLAMGTGAGSTGTFERILTEIGTRARDAALAPVTLPVVLSLVADAARRRIRDDLPVTTAPIDPDDPATWWTGDATTGIGAPIGRTEGRRPVSPWFDESHAGMIVTGPRRSGVSTLLRTLVDGVALIYPPEECQLLLVGLGDRPAFAPFGDGGLPHARLVATDAERELGLSVLEACAAIVERRRMRLEVSGTQRFGLSGHRERTGERLPRLLLAVDGVSELFAADDTTAASATRLLEVLAAEGPTAGVHLLLADRATGAEADALVSRLPHQLGIRVRVGPGSATEDELEEGSDRSSRRDQAVITFAGSADPEAETRFRIAETPEHLRRVTIGELGRRAAAGGFTARPQVVRGDRGGDLSLAPLSQLTGDAERRDARRTPRLWLGEPVGLGPPVEVTFRRQEGANLVVVSHDPAIGQGALFAAVATAAMVHDRSLEVWVVDFLPLEAGFGARFLALGERSVVHVGRRRNLSKILDTVHRLVQDRLVGNELNGPPRLLVVNGLGRAHDFDAEASHVPVLAPAPGDLGDAADEHDLPPDSLDRLDPVGVLEAILRDGPEVGVHTLVWCDTVELLYRRLGPDALREFGLRVGGAMSQEDSVALLDSTYGATLRPAHALLYDEDHGRLVKLRPYALPPDGWVPPA